MRQRRLFVRDSSLEGFVDRVKKMRLKLGIPEDKLMSAPISTIDVRALGLGSHLQRLSRRLNVGLEETLRQAGFTTTTQLAVEKSAKANALTPEDLGALILAKGHDPAQPLTVEEVYALGLRYELETVVANNGFVSEGSSLSLKEQAIAAAGFKPWRAENYGTHTADNLRQAVLARFGGRRKRISPSSLDKTDSWLLGALRVYAQRELGTNPELRTAYTASDALVALGFKPTREFPLLRMEQMLEGFWPKERIQAALRGEDTLLTIPDIAQAHPKLYAALINSRRKFNNGPADVLDRLHGGEFAGLLYPFVRGRPSRPGNAPPIDKVRDLVLDRYRRGQYVGPGIRDGTRFERTLYDLVLACEEGLFPRQRYRQVSMHEEHVARNGPRRTYPDIVLRLCPSLRRSDVVCSTQDARRIGRLGELFVELPIAWGRVLYGKANGLYGDTLPAFGAPLSAVHREQRLYAGSKELVPDLLVEGEDSAVAVEAKAGIVRANPASLATKYDPKIQPVWQNGGDPKTVSERVAVIHRPRKEVAVYRGRLEDAGFTVFDGEEFGAAFAAFLDAVDGSGLETVVGQVAPRLTSLAPLGRMYETLVHRPSVLTRPPNTQAVNYLGSILRRLARHPLEEVA